MKGSAALLPNDNHVVIVNEGNYQQPHNQCEDLLHELGFEEGELEMFFDMMNHVSENELVEKYLQIARSAPYNLNWQTGHDACIAAYMLGVVKNNGVEYTKHDIVEDVFDSFYHPEQGGRKKKSKRSTKKRTNKKKRSTKRRHRRSRK
jgi:hypothetical protein